MMSFTTCAAWAVALDTIVGGSRAKRRDILAPRFAIEVDS